MRFIDFFAGIGGFRRGMEMAGHECVGFCEWDKFATASYTSMHLITEEQQTYLGTLDLKKRQKEILKDEYRNGEWYSNDVRSVDAGSLPKADIWCFGAPCQDFSIIAAGKRSGLAGNRSSLVREIFRLLRETREADRPEWIIYENVKGMLSSNRGYDYLAILLEMDELGYDLEWQNFNSKHFGVPQNRERIYTIGHLRTCGRRKILPVRGTNEANRIYRLGHAKGYRRWMQIFSPQGITEAIDTAQGGGREPHVAVEVIGGIGDKNFGKQWRQGNRIYDGNQIATSLKANPVGNAAGYTDLYAFGDHDTNISVRRLTPKECFRLQGWTDDYFNRAQFVNSDSQLYKQAGNGVTVTVVYEIAKRLEGKE